MDLKQLVGKHPHIIILAGIILLSVLLIFVLGKDQLFRGTEDVVIINEFGASERETRDYTETRAEDYVRMQDSAETVIPDLRLLDSLIASGYEEESHFYNLIADEDGNLTKIRDEGFRFLKNGKQEVFLAFSREGIPLRRTRMSMMHVKLSQLNQIPMTIMGGVSAAKEERYQVFIQDYKGIYVYIRTVHLTQEELTVLLQEFTEELAQG